LGISSPGIGSNLDVNSIVTQLMTIEQKPLVTLSANEASYQSKLSAIGSVKGALASFQGSVQSLSALANFQRMQVSAADATVATASGTVIAAPGNYSLEVTQLAQAQKLASAGQASITNAVGTGVISFDLGAISGGTLDPATGKYTGAGFTSSGNGIQSVTIASGNNSLTGIRDAINSAKIGVTAAIVNDGSGSPWRLTLTQTATGNASSMKISVAGDASLQSLLNNDPAAGPAGQSLSEIISAQNALLKVDGISVTKASNTVSDVIQGVTLNLAKTNAGNPTTISVARDTGSVANAVTAFVNAYNQINKTLTDVSSYDASTKTAAILNGDSTVRNIQTQLRAVLSSPIAGNTGLYGQLFQIGVTLQKDGTLAVDSSKLQTAMDSNFGDIAALFAATGKASDTLVNYSGASSATKPGSYALNVSQMARRASVAGSAPASGAPTAGTFAGSAAAGLTIDGTNDTLQIQLDGASAAITLAHGSFADANALATEVQNQINANAAFAGKSVAATQSNGILTLGSGSQGAASSVSVTGGNGLSTLFGAMPVGSGGSETSITAGVNDSLSISLDGATQTITLAPGKYSFAGLATQIQSKINGTKAFSDTGASVTVSQSGGVMIMTSNSYGATSVINVVGGNGQAALFGSTLNLVQGLDIAGTINGVPAIGLGELLTGATGDASQGLRLTIESGTTGARGNVNYSTGYASQFNTLATSLLGTDGPLAARADGINASLKTLSNDRDRINAQLVDTEARYRAEFTALDTLLGSMTQTSTFLTQQLAALTKSTA
jgi:flagellar hook-associated protein 2